MNRTLLLLLTALCLPACDQTSGVSDTGPANGSATVAKHYEGPKPEGVSTPNDAVTTTFYIPQAAIGDMYEIEAGELALVRGRAPEVTAFARQMVADHRKTSAQLKAFVADHPTNIAIPQNMDARRQAMLANLNQAGPDEFDSVYVGQQAAAHQEALNLHGSYARRGDYPALKALATKTVDLISAHKRHAEALATRFGPEARPVPSGT